MINLSTGPTALSKKVYEALNSEPISHRSEDFHNLQSNVIDFFRDHLNVNEVYTLQGSGTLANEAMLWQIKSRRKRGIILSNGEFGNRLIEQSERIGLDFKIHSIAWGETFLLEKIEEFIALNQMDWILCAHCETSTGVVNDIEALSELAKKNNCALFLDCMSSMATIPLDLFNISMATASSGKGLCSLSGIALVFANIEIHPNEKCPKYLDLYHYKNANGIPFTFSSIQLQALHNSIQEKMNNATWKQKDFQAKKLYNLLNPLGIIPFANVKSRVFTLVMPNIDSQELGLKLNKNGLISSYQSNYLLERNWLQLTLFGSHTDAQIDEVITILKNEIMPIHALNQSKSFI